ncbi:MAG: sigma 54-interacting transcriptional regulator [Firmicutes bacterium]|nr:sigma 54-interacting transcriptional regulator [Bacillota bacterium]
MTRQNEILRTVLNLTDEAVHIIDRDGITWFYNKVSAEMEGMDPEEVLGKHILEVYPSLTLESSSMLEVLRTRKPVLNQQQTLINRKGRAVTMSYSTYPIFNRKRIVGVCDISRDITRIKELTEKLLDLQASLLGKKTVVSSKANSSRKNPSGARYTFNDLVGQDPVMIELKVAGQKVAPSSSPILVYGETGTGKELLIQAIHNAGPNRGGPYIAQNCAALPATLLESILFGTVKGSFTGAEDRQGLFEMADGGTLLFDEINSMPVELQGKLLRVLQDGTFRRIGDHRLREVNVRVIASTNVDPLEAVREQQIRLDLYYRLNVVSLRIPPLRERPDDIMLLAGAFIREFNESFNRNIKGVTPRVERIFKSYNWPGNVRELRHSIEHAMNLVEGSVIDEGQLPFQITQIALQPNISPGKAALEGGLPEAVRLFEKEIITTVMQQCYGNVSRAARRLQVPRQTLQYKLKSYGIAAGKF